MLVDLFDLSRPAVWRVCSAVFAAIGGVHTAALPRRYRAAAESAPPLRVYVHRGVRWLLLLALLLTAVGVPHLPGVGLYGLAVTYWLGQVCHVFCTRLSEFQSEAPVADQGLPLAAPASP
jgi:hypothetical protein